MKYLPLLLILMGCYRPVIKNASRIPTPIVVDSLWRELQECTMTKEKLPKIHWYLVPSEDFFDPYTLPPRKIVGLWIKPHTIYLGYYAFTNMWVIKHELLHDLLQGGSFEDVHDEIFLSCHVY